MPATTVIEQVLAALVVAVCAVLLVRLFVGPTRRHRFDRWVRRSAETTRRRWMMVWGWRASRKRAAREAQEAIARARRGDWQGNVYTPKSFKRPRKPH